MKKLNQLFSITIRVPKEESAFCYFMLEAHEGLCFYSTLEFQKGQGFRDIHLQGSIDFHLNFSPIA
ncbi:MAG: hypothetical protein ISR65_07135 [Bacteriovoracaceae bacterium]|nr:hypothetical protein [Bacteriovoracaceae bacterium]